MPLARFTPSLLDGETLERLFVHREGLLNDVLARIQASARSDERRHRLFVGPRGAGKTHLISLVHHRALAAQAAGLPVKLAWLREDPWDIETYEDLLQQILEQVQPDGRRGRDNAEGQLLRAAEGFAIVVLAENLDQILAAIGRDGQQRLRALLENDRPLLLIATCTRLSDDLLSQAEPFYGFFDTTQLEPFTVDQAADMLAAVAEVSDEPALGTLLRTPAGRARLATINHLAGGQPRVWALLGTGLTSSGIDDMVEMLLSRFDDLTPYYQEQLARLSPNEAKVVRRLADADRPLTVNALADVSRIDPKSVAKTVSDLRRKGWVRQYRSLLTEKADARLRYYELAEPLARIAFQVKAARGEPVKLVVDFLATWYDTEQLSADAQETPTGAYRTAALANRSGTTTALHALLSGAGAPLPPPARPGLLEALALLDDGVDSWERGDPTVLLAQPAILSGFVAQKLAGSSPSSVRVELARFAVLHGGADRWRGRLDALAARSDRLVRAEALLLLGVAALRAGGASSEWVADATLVALAEAVATLETGQADRLVAGAGLVYRTLEFAPRLTLLAALDACLMYGWAWQAVQRHRVTALLSTHRDDHALATAHALADAVRTQEGADSAAHLSALDLLGITQACTGRSADAVNTYREIVARESQVRGDDAHETLQARWTLILVRRRAGDDDVAADLTRLVADCERALGSSNALTRNARAELDVVSNRA